MQAMDIYIIGANKFGVTHLGFSSYLFTVDVNLRTERLCYTNPKQISKMVNNVQKVKISGTLNTDSQHITRSACTNKN